LGRPLIGLAVVVPLVLGALWWRATWVANHLLHVDAPKSIAEKSGGVYVLAVGHVRFNGLRRRIVVDSIELTTNAAVNARRAQPRTSLHLSLHQCVIGGLHFFTLIAGRGLIAQSFGCSAVRGDADVPPGHGEPDTAAVPAAPRQAFFALQKGLRLPKFAPRIAVERIDFPQAKLEVRLRWAQRETTRLELDHLEWHMTDFTVDPADSAATGRPLFSRTVDIRAADFLARPDSNTTVRVAGFAASLPDSAFEIRGIAYAPAMSDSAFARAGPYGRSLLKTGIGRVAVRGFDVGAFVLGAGVRARRVQVDSLHIDLLSDKRRPDDPRPSVHRTPQRWIADIDQSVSVDSVVIRGGEVVYREQRPRHAKPGVLTFARLQAVATNVRHVASRRRGREVAGTPMTLRATAFLQDAGRFDTHFTVPLDAPSFDMTFGGTLGPMPATSLNRLMDGILAVRLEKGAVLGIDFDATVASGAAQGSIVPRYKDLSIAVTGHGSKGILGTGGVVGEAARGVASLVGNLTEIRGDNPDAGATPRRGPIDHTFSPDETLPGFLWVSLRGGLMAVVRK
jgi:hypothetical protein